MSSWPKEFITANQHFTSEGSETKADGSDLVLYREVFKMTDIRDATKPDKKLQPDKEIGEFVIRVEFEKKK